MSVLENRVALVTGAGRGIGRGIALAYGAAGARVAVAARTEAELEEVVSTIRGDGGQATAFPADLADPAVPYRLAAAVKDRLGPVEILVNNAGIGSSARPGPILEFDDDFWELTLRLNLTAPYQLVKAVLPDMLARKWGRVIAIASINAVRPCFHGAAYAASKHGLLGLMRTLAVEVAREGITANTINPGPVKTRMNDRRIAYDAQRLGRSIEEHEGQATPIGGRLAPEDIAGLAVYLASDAARMVTGQAFNVDGGITA